MMIQINKEIIFKRKTPMKREITIQKRIISIEKADKNY